MQCEEVKCDRVVVELATFLGAFTTRIGLLLYPPKCLCSPCWKKTMITNESERAWKEKKYSQVAIFVHCSGVHKGNVRGDVTSIEASFGVFLEPHTRLALAVLP